MRDYSRQNENKFCTMQEKREFKRLPKDVVPSNYNIRLKPDLDAFVFQGQEAIDVEVINAEQPKSTGDQLIETHVTSENKLQIMKYSS